MGFTPAQVKDLSMWEFSAAIDGWTEANAPPEDDKKLTVADRDELWEMVQENM